MAADGKEINAQLVHVKRHFAKALHRVHVQQQVGPHRVHRLAQPGNGLQRANLVVHQHNADQNGVWANHFGDGGQVDNALAVHRQQVKIKILFQQGAGRLHNGLVFHRGDD